jgi:hypothetical protein
MKPEWRKYTKEERLRFAETAASVGMGQAAKTHGVSTTAIRTACAVHGVVPKRVRKTGMTKEERMKRARAMLRALGVTVRELREAAKP